MSYGMRAALYSLCDDNETDFLPLQGVLTVVDVYSEWAGPCLAMANYLKKIKLEVMRFLGFSLSSNIL